MLIDNYLNALNDTNRLFFKEIDDYLQRHDYKLKIEAIKSGTRFTYTCNKNRRAIANFVIEENKFQLHLYADNISSYTDFVQSLPKNILSVLQKGGKCKRLIDADACNPKCIMGYDYLLDNMRYQKCRYLNFKFLLINHEYNAFIERLIKHECIAREAAFLL